MKKKSTVNKTKTIIVVRTVGCILAAASSAMLAGTAEFHPHIILAARIVAIVAAVCTSVSQLHSANDSRNKTLTVEK